MGEIYLIMMVTFIMDIIQDGIIIMVNHIIILGIIINGGVCVGVKTSLGLEIRGRATILTNGTFLNGLIHIGDKNFGGGRA